LFREKKVHQVFSFSFNSQARLEHPVKYPISYIKKTFIQAQCDKMMLTFNVTDKNHTYIRFDNC